MRNHLGTYECRLCLTLHTNEGDFFVKKKKKWASPKEGEAKINQNLIYYVYNNRKLLSPYSGKETSNKSCQKTGEGVKGASGDASAEIKNTQKKDCKNRETRVQSGEAKRSGFEWV